VRPSRDDEHQNRLVLPNVTHEPWLAPHFQATCVVPTQHYQHTIHVVLPVLETFGT